MVNVYIDTIAQDATSISDLRAGIYKTNAYEVLGLPQYAAVVILNTARQHYQKIAFAVTNSDKIGTSSGKGFYVYDSSNSIFKKVLSW